MTPTIPPSEPVPASPDPDLFGAPQDQPPADQAGAAPAGAEHGEWIDQAATAALFAEHAARVDWAAFDALLARAGGEPPAPDDRQ